MNYEAFVRDRLLVYLKKNKDYGDSFATSIKVYGNVAGQVRISDKVNRLKSLLRIGTTEVQESITDTVLDLFNYVVMFNCVTSDSNDLMSIIEEFYFLSEGYNNFASAVNEVLGKEELYLNEKECKQVNELLWGYIVSTI